MSKKNSQNLPSESFPSKPRLGTVMRFSPKAVSAGIKQLEKGGFRVASSSDFKSAISVPNDFGGADVQYFERFGIAIVRCDQERLNPILQRAIEQKAVAGARTERRYKALGFKSIETTNKDSTMPLLLNSDQEYLRGYRDAVNQLIGQLLSSTAQANFDTMKKFEETTVTWGLEAIHANLSSLTGAGIKVAILDTGFDDQHPDFIGRSVTKKSFVSNSSEIDMVGHGTHCIGTACGSARPLNVPRYGVATEAEIYAGKVLGDDGFGTDRSIIAGMDWALGEHCVVISMSLGAEVPIGAQPSEDYEQIGQACLDAGTLVVAAAGNESDRPNRINPVGSPANASTIMAVGAIDRFMQIARFSCGGLNTGQDVDLAAPGFDIFSSLPKDKGMYERLNGTSMATPHVAGIAALIAQSDPKYRGWALWARLLQLTQRLNLPLRDAGRGLVQAPRL